MIVYHKNAAPATIVHFLQNFLSREFFKALWELMNAVFFNVKSAGSL